MDGGLIKRRRQQKTVVDEWRSDRGHVQYLSQSRETGHVVKKRHFPPIIIKLVDSLDMERGIVSGRVAFVATIR